MKQILQPLFLLLFIATRITCMENLPTDILKRIAFAIIETNGHYEYPLKKMKLSLWNFALSNKKNSAIVRALIYGTDNDSINFNDCLIKNMAKNFENEHNPECLAAAYIGTPYALEKLRDNFVKVNNQEKLKDLLGAKDKQVPKTRYIKIPYDGPPSAPYKIEYESEIYWENEKETLQETLARFPRSTSKYIQKMLNEK